MELQVRAQLGVWWLVVTCPLLVQNKKVMSSKVS